MAKKVASAVEREDRAVADVEAGATAVAGSEGAVQAVAGRAVRMEEGVAVAPGVWLSAWVPTG